jgi:hypothetical protein
MTSEPVETALEAVEVVEVDDGAVEAIYLPDEAGPGSLWGPAAIVVVAVLGCSLWANASTMITDPADFRFIPPFRANVNRNQNQHLAAEYYSIAKAMVAGRGFADPFRSETGPTAWMPPVLPVILAGLHWVADGNVEAVTALFVLLQDLTLIGTGILIVLLARQTTGLRWFPLALFVGALTFYFRHCFQFTHDCWIVLAALDLLIAGVVWGRPLEVSRRRAAVWGIFGGLCAMTSPIVGLCWAVLTMASGVQRGRRVRFTIAVVMSILTVAPWVVRNYVLFGRFIPVKSNLAYELYQSQVLQPGGVLRGNIFGSHPYATDGEERWEYRRVGEMAYLDKKMQLFKEALHQQPMDFVERMANRFFAATLEYTPFDAGEEVRRPWMMWLSRLTYPLPFLSLLVLLIAIPWRPLSGAEGIVVGVYLTYLLPYVIISYYDRYKFPLLAAEVILVVWAVSRFFRRAT